jgi:hypothetical protein
MHPDLEALLRADEEARQALASAEQRLAERAQAARTHAATERERRRQVATGELEREIRAIEDAARHEAADRERARAFVRDERRSASAAAVAEAVSQYLAIVTGRADRAEGER